MNIGPQYIKHTRSGFTLIEMILVIVTVSIIIGASIFLLSTDTSDEIHTLPTEIEQLAKTSLAKAKMDKRTQYIILSKDQIWHSPDPYQQKPEENSSKVIDLPLDSKIGYRRSSETNWQWIENNEHNTAWTFSVSGICEEIYIYIKLNNSSAEISFHPLTAAIIQP